ncbi:MAG TPA: hypothetical protein VHA52_09050, partial [Candidatus Babeliaceae bacterium]|nr:hypothetical protein [Candidatus Babeliaceae bacterium]
GATILSPSFAIKTHGGLIANNPIKLQGSGPRFSLDILDTFSYIGSIWYDTSPTDTLLTINGKGTYIDGMAFINNSNAIPTTGSLGLCFVKAGTFTISNSTVKSFYENINIKEGLAWILDNDNFINPVSTNLEFGNEVLYDEGDPAIANCQFTSNNNNVTHILQHSSGGLKIINTKIHPTLGNSSRYYCAVCLIIDSPGTSILQIDNASIEGWSGYGVRVKTKQNAGFTKVGISNCNFNPVSTITGHCIELDSINFVEVTGNIFIDNNANTQSAIYLNDVLHADFYPNQHDAWATFLTQTNSSFIYYLPILSANPLIANSILYGNNSGQATQLSNIVIDPIDVRLGINTTSPSYSIDVTGTGRFRGDIILGKPANNPCTGDIHTDLLNNTIGGAIRISSGSSSSLGFTKIGTETNGAVFTNYLNIGQSNVIDSVSLKVIGADTVLGKSYLFTTPSIITTDSLLGKDTTGQLVTISASRFASSGLTLQNVMTNNDSTNKQYNGTAQNLSGNDTVYGNIVLPNQLSTTSAGVLYTNSVGTIMKVSGGASEGQILQYTGGKPSWITRYPTTVVTTDYTVSDTDYTVIADCGSNAITVTLPISGIPNGKIFNVKKINGTSPNDVTITAGTVTIDGSSTITISTLNETVRLQWDSVNGKWWTI